MVCTCQEKSNINKHHTSFLESELLQLSHYNKVTLLINMKSLRVLFAITIGGLSINTMAVGLRVWLRSRKNGAFGYDDGALCIAFVGSNMSLRVNKYAK